MDVKQLNEIIETTPAVMVKFGAPWCGPCKMMNPIVKAMQEEYSDNDSIAILDIDIDECPDIAQELNIRSVPEFRYYKAGEMVNSALGAQPPTILKESIASILE